MNNRREVKPPWPNIFVRIYNIIAIFLIFLSVIFMVIVLALDCTKNIFNSYIYQWKYRMVKDCQLLHTEEGHYFFYCQEYDFTSNLNSTNPPEKQNCCQDCQEQDQALQYNIKLPLYR